MRNAKSVLTVAAALLLASVLLHTTAHARVGGDDWVAVPYAQEGLTINAKSLELKKGKLWVQLQVVNNTGKIITFNPDQIQARLPDGSVVTRLKGVFDDKSAAHQVKLIQPGAGQDFALEYQVGEPVRITLSLQSGIQVAGKPKAFPDFQITRPDQAWKKGKYQSKGIAVSLVSVMPTKKGVEVKLKIENNNDAPILIDKNGFRVRLPDGSDVAREKTLLKNVFAMYGHATDEVALEFNCGNPASFAIVMDGINEGQLALPEFPVSR